jgi:tRNA dimethylallyltransferase
MVTDKVIVIVGPTASGKSALALQFAQEIGGEIICADSRTVYRGLDVATAKPTAAERALAPHWGLDLMEPSERFSAADFKLYAQRAIVDIQKRGTTPIVVGGTGLYIDGLLFDFDFGPPANEKERAVLEDMSIEALQQKIAELGIAMPENKQNKRYLMRAIEQGGINTRKATHMQNAVVVGLRPDMMELEARIQARAVSMLKNGALDEARWLFDTYGAQAPAAAAPFFKAYAAYIAGNETLDTCTQKDIVLNRQLAKRQLTWFKRNPHIHWFSNTADAYNFLHTLI